MAPRRTRASADSRASPSATPPAKSRTHDAIKFKGHGKLRGTVAILEDGEELEVDAEQLSHYLYFLRERQSISNKRFAREPRPWTKDDVLRGYRFAEIFRLFDRGSQYIKRHVIDEGDQSLEECSFRCILYRVFARQSTWEYLQNTLGELTWKGFNRKRYVQALDKRVASREALYTSAYQAPAPSVEKIGGRSSHERHLRLVELMMRTSLPQRLLELPELCDQYHFVQRYPSMGSFLALRIVLDLNMIPSLTRPHDWATPGPGAKMGTALIFSQKTGKPPSEKHCIQAFRWLQRNGNRLFLKAGYQESDIPALTDGEIGLTAIDHEHALCEFSKYVRIAAGNYGKDNGKYKFTRPNPVPVTRELPQGWKSLAEACARRDAAYTQPAPAVGNAKEDEAEWYVSHIVAKDKRDEEDEDVEPRYLVRWEGYSPLDDTWVPESNLEESSREVLEEYKAKIQLIEDMRALYIKGKL
ncbi:unnamed protein product [Peniophora sp. CBMAI 1063]|nr:unnamed protein product [Peniophora sp. CBMAI 1063]